MVVAREAGALFWEQDASVHFSGAIREKVEVIRPRFAVGARDLDKASRDVVELLWVESSVSGEGGELQCRRHRALRGSPVFDRLDDPRPVLGEAPVAEKGARLLCEAKKALDEELAERALLFPAFLCGVGVYAGEIDERLRSWGLDVEDGRGPFGGMVCGEDERIVFEVDGDDGRRNASRLIVHCKYVRKVHTFSYL